MKNKIGPSKSKKLKILFYLRGVLKETNCHMCNEIGIEFPEYNLVHLRCFLPELYNERPVFVNIEQINIDSYDLFSSWGTADSDCSFDARHDREAKRMWDYRKRAVENAIDKLNGL